MEKQSNWIPEQGYVDFKNGEPYPYRTFGTGKRDSLLVLLRTLDKEIDYLCGGATEGYKVTFHLPNEWPQMWKKQFQVSRGNAASFMITPNLIVTSPNIRDYDPNVRQCYFTAERSLRFFRFYTQHNCELECLSNYTLSECGCVQFAMPSKLFSEAQCLVQLLSSEILHSRIERYENLWTSKNALLI